MKMSSVFLFQSNITCLCICSVSFCYCDIQGISPSGAINHVQGQKSKLSPTASQQWLEMNPWVRMVTVTISGCLAIQNQGCSLASFFPLLRNINRVYILVKHFWDSTPGLIKGEDTSSFSCKCPKFNSYFFRNQHEYLSSLNFFSALRGGHLRIQVKVEQIRIIIGTERLHFHFSLSCIGKGNGNPLQCSCLENPKDRGAWWAAVYGVAQSWTRLKRLSSRSSQLSKTLREWTYEW